LAAAEAAKAEALSAKDEELAAFARSHEETLAAAEAANAEALSAKDEELAAFARSHEETMAAAEAAKAGALSAKDEELAAFARSHEETLAAAEAAKAEALSAKDEELAAFARGHAVSNEEHAALLAAREREASVAHFQLQEAEAAAEELEGRLRKLAREKKFLKDELDEVRNKP
jgi:hypothetical protein